MPGLWHRSRHSCGLSVNPPIRDRAACSRILCRPAGVRCGSLGRRLESYGPQSGCASRVVGVPAVDDGNNFDDQALVDNAVDDAVSTASSTALSTNAWSSKLFPSSTAGTPTTLEAHPD